MATNLSIDPALLDRALEVSLFADTSVWSLALRRNGKSAAPQIGALHSALEGEDLMVTTGIVLQELLQGFAGPRARDAIIDRFSALPLLVPDRHDHVEAASLRNVCRRAGVQLGTIDALLAQLCIHHDLIMLKTDGEFGSAAQHCPLKVWAPDAGPSASFRVPGTRPQAHDPGRQGSPRQ